MLPAFGAKNMSQRQRTGGTSSSRPEIGGFCPCVEGKGKAAEGSKILAPYRVFLLLMVRGRLFALLYTSEVKNGDFEGLRLFFK